MASYSLQQFECDPEKARARQQCLDALLESFPDEKERMNLKVVHLTGPSRAEYEQVYKKAGISSGNVYGIEQDAKAYALVDNENKKADDKIVLCQEPIQQFLQREEAPFDVVSLDFDTTYNRALVQSLDALFDPHCPRISNKSMLYVNVQARRENTGFQNRLYFLQGFSRDL